MFQILLAESIFPIQYYILHFLFLVVHVKFRLTKKQQSLFDTLQNMGIQNIAQAIEDTRYKNCPKCELLMSSSNHYAPFLTLGVDLFNNSNIPSKFYSSPNELILGQQEFVLTDVR